MSCPISWPTRILSGAALALILLLVVGFLLPGTWDVDRERRLEAAPGVVYPLLVEPAAWREWTTWPDSGVSAEGPARGEGAALSWDDPELGEGTFTIVEARAPELVRYEVTVMGGSMRFRGEMHLIPDGDGTLLTWRERGDLGRNPLMGYWALFMERAQGTELEKSLQRLDSVATAGAPSR